MEFESDGSSSVRVSRMPGGSVYEDTRLGVVLATVKPQGAGLAGPLLLFSRRRGSDAER